MKTLFTMLLITCIGHLQMVAQTPDGDKKQDVQKVIVAYVTQSLNLTQEEANQFFPVFKEYMKEHRNAVKANEKDEIAKAEGILVVQKKYKPKFTTILNSETRANKAFKMHAQLLNRLKTVRDRRQQGRGAGKAGSS